MAPTPLPGAGAGVRTPPDALWGAAVAAAGAAAALSRPKWSLLLRSLCQLFMGLCCRW